MTNNTEQIDWGHWIYRLIALIIDSIIAFIVGAVIFYVVLVPLPWWGTTFVLPFIYGIVLVLYSVIFEVTWNGMTIGKKLLGLQVQTANGGKVPFDKSFIRNISKIYWLLLLLDWLLGILTPGNKRQKYFDRIAGTMVVQTKQTFGSVPPPPPPPPT